MASAVINAAPEGNLSRYLREIRKFPMLSLEEELSLSRRWRDHQDVEAAHKLVTSHLRLVAKIAMGYRGYGLPVGELISEGNVGMMQAVRRFDPERGFRLATYAVQTTRNLVAVFIKFTSRVQHGHNHLQGANAFFFMYINRNAPAIILNPYGVIG